MRILRSPSPSILLALALLFATPGAAVAQCVSGTITASLEDTGPHAGLWKYTLDIFWNTTQGLSNVTLDCGFGECKEQACARAYAFDVPAGQSDGEPEGCTVDYEGEFNCNGNPSIGLEDPIVKWDALDAGGCEAANSGAGELCFYTDRGPEPNSQAPVILIKNGQQVCVGTVVGDCPAICTVPVEPATWGSIKTDYR